VELLPRSEAYEEHFLREQDWMEWNCCRTRYWRKSLGPDMAQYWMYWATAGSQCEALFSDSLNPQPAGVLGDLEKVPLLVTGGSDFEILQEKKLVYLFYMVLKKKSYHQIPKF
jgi:hypothetical protein